MNKYLFFICISVVLAQAQTAHLKEASNPLLMKWNTPHQTPPFNLIKIEHYLPAVDAAIKEAKDDIDAIIINKKAPSFYNTIVALELFGKELDKITPVLYALSVAHTSKELQKVMMKVSPMLSELDNYIYLNEELFARVKKVYQKRAKLKLKPEPRKLLEKTYKDFIRKGANLKGPAKKRYEVVTKQLSKLILRFSNNVLAETNAYTKHITDKKELAGLPDSALETAAHLAKSKGKEGWMFNLQYPSYSSILEFADNRELRKEIFIAVGSLANKGNDNDNNKIVFKITSLRMELANLLGYKTYAHYILEERMAQTPERVSAFLMDYHKASRPVAQRELAVLKEFAKRKGFTGEFQAWDARYYIEKLREETYGFNEEETKPYFQLEKVKQGIFDLTNRLWGLTYKKNQAIPVYHPDVEAVEVYEADGSFVGVLYMDFFPRASKRNGGWTASLRPQSNVYGKFIHPICCIVCNLSKPTETKPSLLSLNEANTFLHEFGHALHELLSRTKYASFSGYRVYWDFVELPSQIMENWLFENEWLNTFARHYKTNEKMPETLIKKFSNARYFMVGGLGQRQLERGLLDMAWHTIEKKSQAQSVWDFEIRAIAPTRLFPVVKGTAISTSFRHIFSGAYASGYYSYKWAEVLEADAYSMFIQNGIFDKKTAASFRQNILEKGGSKHPMILYKRFRGREPTIDALLKKSGLIKQ